jgi:hypothetical protein
VVNPDPSEATPITDTLEIPSPATPVGIRSVCVILLALTSYESGREVRTQLHGGIHDTHLA